MLEIAVCPKNNEEESDYLIVALEKNNIYVKLNHLLVVLGLSEEEAEKTIKRNAANNESFSSTFPLASFKQIHSPNGKSPKKYISRAICISDTQALVAADRWVEDNSDTLDYPKYRKIISYLTSGNFQVFDYYDICEAFERYRSICYYRKLGSNRFHELKKAAIKNLVENTSASRSRIYSFINNLEKFYKQNPMVCSLSGERHREIFVNFLLELTLVLAANSNDFNDNLDTLRLRALANTVNLYNLFCAVEEGKYKVVKLGGQNV